MTESLLRPVFTRALATRLAAGASINLTAPHGFGRRRTLADLRGLLPDGMLVLHADMKFCLQDYPSMLDGLCEQAGLKVTIPDFRELTTRIHALGRPCLLILHNIDLLRGEPHDPRFDSDMLAGLPAFSEHARLALLTVSEDLYPDWQLPCEPLPLPPLEHPEPG